MSSSVSLAEARGLLKEDRNGKNLYDHLTETLMKIIIDRPENAFDIFEQISSEVKANPLDPSPNATLAKPHPVGEDQMNRVTEWSKNCATLLKVPDEPPEEAAVRFPDLMDEATLLEWAGCSIGRAETHRLYLAVKALAEGLPGEVERLRFFGMVQTLGAPYYVIEGISPEDEEGIDEMKQEGKAGVNKYAYWVTQAPESKIWTKLPNVTSDHIVKATQFRRYLTGNLEAVVPSYPPFGGLEKHLLRAMLAQIVGATSISPEGYFVPNEDDPLVIQVADAEALAASFPKAAADMKDAETWRHHELEVNKIGRITALPPVLGEDGEPIEPDEPIEVTEPLATPKPESWAMRVFPGGSGTATASCVVARSLAYPGAVAVAAGRRFLNFYVGNGLPYASTPYSPPLPAPVISEWVPTAEDGSDVLLEQEDTKVDPTPPAAEEPEEE